MGGLAASRVLDLFGERMVERDFCSGLAARLYHKDLEIVLSLAKSLGQEVPAGVLVMEHLDALIEKGKGELDLASMVEIIEALEVPKDA